MIATIFIVLGLITATGAAVKATEILVTRGARGFRGLARVGSAMSVLYGIAEEFRPNNGESLRDQIDLIRSEQVKMRRKLDGDECRFHE